MDKNPLLRKGLAVGITLLFITISIIPSTAQDIEKPSLPTSSGSWLYVGGSGPGNYTKIQEAIDIASNGDFIFVFAGIYYENILIYKSLYLIGENAETTIIDGQGIKEVVIITADFVTIERFTIQNSSLDVSKITAGITVKSNHTSISNNIIVDNNETGIFLRQASYTTIWENNISENGYGIWCHLSIHNKITRNNIHNNYYGIFLAGDSSKNQIIANIIHHNECGILMLHCTQSSVQENTILSNDGTGMKLAESHLNTIQSNTIAYNGNIGILLENSNANVISDNIIQGHDQGIQIIWGRNNKIHRNNFVENPIPASFSLDVPFRFLIILVRNNWINNYWDDHHSRLPKLIFGTLIYPPDSSNPWDKVQINWIAIDWHPAQEPYDI